MSSDDPRPLLGFPGSRRIVRIHDPIDPEKALRTRDPLSVVAMRPKAALVGSLAAKAMSPLSPYRCPHVIPHGVGSGYRQHRHVGALLRQAVLTWEQAAVLWESIPRAPPPSAAATM